MAAAVIRALTAGPYPAAPGCFICQRRIEVADTKGLEGHLKGREHENKVFKLEQLKSKLFFYFLELQRQSPDPDGGVGEMGELLGEVGLHKKTTGGYEGPLGYYCMMCSVDLSEGWKDSHLMGHRHLDSCLAYLDGCINNVRNIYWEAPSPEAWNNNYWNTYYYPPPPPQYRPMTSQQVIRRPAPYYNARLEQQPIPYFRRPATMPWRPAILTAPRTTTTTGIPEVRRSPEKDDSQNSPAPMPDPRLQPRLPKPLETNLPLEPALDPQQPPPPCPATDPVVEPAAAAAPAIIEASEDCTGDASAAPSPAAPIIGPMSDPRLRMQSRPRRAVTPLPLAYQTLMLDPNQHLGNNVNGESPAEEPLSPRIQTIHPLLDATLSEKPPPPCPQNFPSQSPYFDFSHFFSTEDDGTTSIPPLNKVTITGNKNRSIDMETLGNYSSPPPPIKPLPFLHFGDIIGYKLPEEASEALDLLTSGSQEYEVHKYVRAECLVKDHTFTAIGRTEDEAKNKASRQALTFLKKSDETAPGSVKV